MSNNNQYQSQVVKPVSKNDVVEDNLLCISNRIFYNGSYNIFPWVTQKKRYDVRIFMGHLYFTADDGKDYNFNDEECRYIFADQHKISDMKIETLFDESIL